jgi:outer membrane receptor for ferrienterochelin and colicins
MGSAALGDSGNMGGQEETMAIRHLTDTEPPMRAKPVALAIIVMVIAALLDPAPRAQEAPVPRRSPYSLSLEELLTIKISTASLRPQEVREAPATIYVVTEEDFRRYGYRDLKDILRNLPGIDYNWPGSHLFGGQRGFSSQWELTKLLINGREANALPNDAAFIVNQFNLTGVKRVEIVQGAASVLYGPEAFSGVINIITKDAENSEAGSELAGMFGGGDHSSQGGNGAYHSVAKKGPFSLALGGYMDGGRGPDFTEFVKTREYAEANRGLRTYLLENGFPYRNDYHDLKFNADLAYSPQERVKIRAGALYVESQQGAGLEFNQLAYTNDQTLLAQMHFHASGEYGFSTAPVKATLAYHHIGEDFLNRFQSSDTTAGFPPYLAAFNFENSALEAVNLQVDYFPSIIDNYFLVGAGMRDTRVGKPAYTGLLQTDTLPGQAGPMIGRYIYPPTGIFANLHHVLHQNRIYAYAQDQQSLLEKKIQITAGMRYDYNDVYGDIWNFRGGIVAHPLANYAIRGLFGQGFREPVVVHLINADIKPARMNFWEASFLFNPVRHLSGQVAYYQNFASKLIVIAPAPGSPSGFLPQNLGKREVSGVETLIKYQLGPLAGDLWHCYEFSIDDQPLIGSPETKLGLGGNYSLGEALSLGLRAKYTSPAEGQAFDAAGIPQSITVPQYFSLDANALAGNLGFAGVRWDVSFSISNLLDRENLYVNTITPNPGRYLAEGREFIGKVAVRF